MREGWARRKLGDLIELISGQHITSTDYNTIGCGVGYLTGPSDFGPISPVITKWTEHPKIKAKKNDILITVKGSGVGKVNLLDDDEVAISRQLMAIRVVSAVRKFVYLFLESAFEHFQEESTGAAIPGISREQVMGLPIAVPSVAEQQRIVGVLDEAFAGLAVAQANAAKNLQNARALFDSHLQAVFSQWGKGWVETTVGELIGKHGGEIKTGPFGTKLKASEYSEKGVPVISVGEIRIGKIVIHNRTPRVDSGITERMPEYVLEEGDIVFGRKGAVERSACVTTVQAGWFLGSDGIRLRLPKNCNRRFIGFQLLKPTHKKWMLSQAVGTTMPSLNQKVIAKIPIAMCPIELQDMVVTQLDALAFETQRLTRIYEQKQAQLAALKKSLLHQAFNGNL